MSKPRKQKKVSNKSAKRPRKKLSLFQKFLRLTTFNIIFGIGVLLLLSGIFLKLHSLTSLSFAQNVNSIPVVEDAAEPTFIRIPKSKTTLPVETTAIRGGIWGINDSGASYLGRSARPGTAGNIIMYAHNTDDKFGGLSELSIGDTIIVTTKDGTPHVYTVKKIETVLPTAIDRLTSDSSETLTLYTCTGFADLKRLIVKASPIES